MSTAKQRQKSGVVKHLLSTFVPTNLSEVHRDGESGESHEIYSYATAVGSVPRIVLQHRRISRVSPECGLVEGCRS